MNTKLDFETIDMLSKGITQFAFRSEPVENLHERNYPSLTLPIRGENSFPRWGRLGWGDMKTLNKFMANHIAGLLTTISKGDIANILQVLIFYTSLSSDWNSCKPDTEEFYVVCEGPP